MSFTPLLPIAQIAVENAVGMNVPGGKVRPSVLALSRQGMPNLPGSSVEGVAKGGYVVHGGDGKPDLIILSTGMATIASQMSCSCYLIKCLVILILSTV